MEIKVLNMNGEKVGETTVSESIFNIEVNEQAVHMAVVQYLANQRQGTKCTKTRAEVRGGGRKPWRQKGTGRARQGSIRSPQWKGGGVVFAPKPRDYSIKLNKKLKRLALKSVFTTKVKSDKFIIVDDITFNEIKTKRAIEMLSKLDTSKALIVLEDTKPNVILSARNIPNVKTARVNTINVYDILKYDTLVVTKKALEQIEEVYA